MTGSSFDGSSLEEAARARLTGEDDLRRRVAELERERSGTAALIDLILGRAIGLGPIRGFAVPTVTSPDGGVLHSGDNQIIRWIGFSGNNVKIDLYRGDLHQGAIASATPNDGSYSWVVPALMEASEYKIIIRNLDDLSIQASSASFAIQAQLQTGEVIHPASGEVLYSGETHAITWTGFSRAQVPIDIYGGTSHQGAIAGAAPNDGSFSWVVPAYMEASDYRGVIRDDAEPSSYASSGNFEIQTQPPTAEVIHPAGGEVYFPGDTMDIQWSGIAGSTVKIDRYWTNASGGNSGGTLVLSAPNTGSYHWTIPAEYLKRLNPETRIIVRDVSDLSNYASSANFELGKPPQQTQVTAPAAGTTYHHHDYIELTWEGFTGSAVTLELFRGNVPLRKVEGIPNSGSYSWLLPRTPELVESSDYKVMVYDLARLEIATSEAFTIEP